MLAHDHEARRQEGYPAPVRGKFAHRKRLPLMCGKRSKQVPAALLHSANQGRLCIVDDNNQLAILLVA